MSAKYKHVHTTEDAFASLQSDQAWEKFGGAYFTASEHDDFTAGKFNTEPLLQSGIVYEGTPADTQAEQKAARSDFHAVLREAGVVIDLTQNDQPRVH